MVENCIFCNRDLIKDDILYETENFYVKVGLMIASPGHLMVISKKHYSNLFKLPEKLHSEYLELCKRVMNIIQKEFGKTFLVDYGPGGQSINHQHTHFIPLKSSEYEIKDFIKEAIIPKKGKFEKAELRDLNKLVGGRDYIWFGVDNKTYVYYVEGDYNPLKDFGWRDFLLYDKGVKSIPRSWVNASMDLRKEDSIKRKLTKEKLKKYF